MDNAVMIMAVEISASLKKENSLEENVKIACKLAKNHWLVTDENDQFRGMVGALGTFYHDDIVIIDRIKDEMEVIQTMASPNPNIFALLGDRSEPIGLLKFWKEDGKTV